MGARATVSRLLALVLVALLLVTGCAESGPPTSTGAPAANQALSIAPYLPRVDQAGAQRLTSDDLLVAYRLILTQYVDRVDHVMLVEAARRGLREHLNAVGAPPLDLAVLDLAAVEPSGHPLQDWSAVANPYLALANKHPDWPGWDQLGYAAVSAMLDSLGDGHARFITREEMEESTQREYSGIGVQITREAEEGPLLVVEVFDGSPALQAGLRPGDLILAADGHDLTRLSLQEAVNHIKGPEGSAVELLVRRGQRDVSLRVSRATVRVPVVEGQLFDGRIGYLRIRAFDERVPLLAAEVLRRGTQEGARAWVLDLRGNSGGLLQAVAATAGLFTEQGPLGFEIDRGRQRTPIAIQGQPVIPPDTPVVILVDRETSSGGELLAAGLRELGVARILGTTTSGNVAVARQFPLSDGSAVQITVQRAVTPSGAQIDRVGVQPDEEVERTRDDLARGADPPLFRALDVLDQALGTRSGHERSALVR
ncbi:MAG TPA: S41 family peptidase [Chloroflexota bacterium]